MALVDVVSCAAGIRIAQRGSETCGDGSTFTVGPVRAVEPPTGPALDSQRADGVVWRRHWVHPESMIIEFLDVVVVHVSYADNVMTFDRHLPLEQEQHLLLDHVLPLLLAQRGHVVLHGAVISWNGLGVVLVGSSGAGKSTLSGFAWRRGWVLGGDDGAVVTGSRPPSVQPTYATLRLNPDSADLLDLEQTPRAAVLGKWRYAGHGEEAFRLDPVPLHLVAVVEPAPSGDEACFAPLRGIDAHAELFGSTFHAEFGGGRLLPSVIETLATVVESTRVGRLTVPHGTTGLAGAEAALHRELRGEAT